jgi:hypothetical protein
MSFSFSSAVGRILVLAGMTVAAAACSGNTGNGAQPPPLNAAGNSLNVTNPGTDYHLILSATFNNYPPATTANPATSSFDIGWVDPAQNQYYIADRNNNGVTVLDTRSGGFLRTAGAGAFTGFKPNGQPGNVPATNAGPNGIVSVGNGIVFAGDGDSTMKIVNANTGAVLGNVTAVNPYKGPPLPATCGGPGIPTTGLANQRMDEMAFDPADGIVLGINDASCPPFATFFSTTAPYSVVGSLAFLTANAGAEQPTWDPGQVLFIMALPATIANPNGEIDLISPKTFTVVKAIGLTTTCNPNGTALGKNEALFLGCSATGANAQMLTVSATNPAVVLNAIPGHGGCDEVQYNPTADRFYAACSNDAPTKDILVVSGTGTLITTLPGGQGQHSVAVDPNQDRVYVPTQTAGIAIFGH